MVATKMMDSLQNAAQLTFHGDADLSVLRQTRAEWKQSGKSISIEDCVIAALVGAVRRFPQFNALSDEDSLTVHSEVNVAVAMSTPSGLLTPVIKQAHTLSLEDLSAQRRTMASAARNGSLNVTDMKGGTITVSNLGLTRVRYFTPILNTPQVCLLGVGTTQEHLYLAGDGQIAEKPLMGLSLTVDHRFIDGEPAGLFLTEIISILERAAFDV